ncbi:hypothetical protein KCU64_g91, partial [Aureobasidium melanogenum]
MPFRLLDVTVFSVTRLLDIPAHESILGTDNSYVWAGETHNLESADMHALDWRGDGGDPSVLFELAELDPIASDTDTGLRVHSSRVVACKAGTFVRNGLNISSLLMTIGPFHRSHEGKSLLPSKAAAERLPDKMHKATARRHEDSQDISVRVVALVSSKLQMGNDLYLQGSTSFVTSRAEAEGVTRDTSVGSRSWMAHWHFRCGSYLGREHKESRRTWHAGRELKIHIPSSGSSRCACAWAPCSRVRSGMMNGVPGWHMMAPNDFTERKGDVDQLVGCATSVVVLVNACTCQHLCLVQL